MPHTYSARCLLVLLGLLACSKGNDPTSSPGEPRIELLRAADTLNYLGQSKPVSATVYDADGEVITTAITWSSTDPAIASVSPEGLVTALAAGRTRITASIGTDSVSLSLLVRQIPAVVELSPAARVLPSIGATLTLTAAAADSGGTAIGNLALTWSSTNPGIATVSSTGEVRAMANGSTRITAAAGSIRDTTTVTVQQLVASVTFTTVHPLPDTIRGVGVRYPLHVALADSNGNRFTAPGLQWTSSDTTVARIDSLGRVYTRGEGRTQFRASLGGVAGTWTANVVRVRRLAVDPNLATPIAGALWQVPVILIEYLPTSDGIGLDTLKAPDFYVMNPVTLNAMEGYILDITKRRKMMVEEGSRFRGYKNAAALPSLGYRVVEHIIVYDQIPPHPTKRDSRLLGNPPFEGWHATFADLQLAPLVETRDVRELWVAWSSFDGGYPSYTANPGAFSLNDMRSGWESNMASPTTGDVSNSDQDPNDAPVLSHTYIIYGINYRRSQAEAVHNVGHQLERMFGHRNNDLFWRSFVGTDALGASITGRAGWTHMPPNTVGNYDYLNTTLVAADIEDWRPDNTGQKTSVNVNTWGTKSYPWPGANDFPQRVESQWYTYWFQNMPGRGNTIPHGSNWMTNWWAFVADWDAAVASGLRLFAATPSATSGDGTVTQDALPSTVTRPETIWTREEHLPRR